MGVKVGVGELTAVGRVMALGSRVGVGVVVGCWATGVAVTTTVTISGSASEHASAATASAAHKAMMTCNRFFVSCDPPAAYVAPAGYAEAPEDNHVGEGGDDYEGGEGLADDGADHNDQQPEIARGEGAGESLKRLTKGGLRPCAAVADHQGADDGYKGRNRYYRLVRVQLVLEGPVTEAGQDQGVRVAIQQGVKESAKEACHGLGARQVAVDAIDD